VPNHGHLTSGIKYAKSRKHKSSTQTRANNGSSQGRQSNMNVEMTLETDAQLAETGKSGRRAPRHPAMLSRRPFAFCATTRDTCGDTTLSQTRLAAVRVITLARMHFDLAFAGPLSQPPHGRKCIECGRECHRIMPVDARYHDDQRPGSRGRSSHGIPVSGTNAMRLIAAHSSTVRRRLPLGEGMNAGINGSRAAHSSLPICRRSMPIGYGANDLTSRLC
jgi:hypothetical protein